MNQHFNGLTPEEHEALSLLMEECGEVVHIIGKIMRHGLDSENPKTGEVNRDALAKECSDLRCSIDILVREELISDNAMKIARRAKVKKMREPGLQLLHHIDPL